MTGGWLVPLSPASGNANLGGTSVVASPTGMIVPLYTKPTDGSWAALIYAKTYFPDVPVMAIINPDSGPGGNMSSQYATGVRALQAAGITVLGYVATSFGSRPINAVEQDIYAYWSWYHVNGTMFDEMPSASGYEGYYSALNHYAKSLGMTVTVGNPGQSIAASYVGILGTLIVYENSGLPNASSIADLYQSYGGGSLAIISYGVNSSRQLLTIGDLSNWARYIYVTNATLPNPYHSLPPYLMSEFSLLNVRRR
jgi:hypothetical protein